MLKVDFNLAFNSSPESILEFFQRPGIGFYIPNYQRPYSWDEENITQMMEDICSGVDMLRTNEEAVTYFGTVIMLAADKKKTQVAPKDPKAIPAEVLITIDGQQRLSTLALLGIHLHYTILDISRKLPEKTPFFDIVEEAKNVASDVQNLFSLDLKSGIPSLKPKIIRAQDDTWTFNGPDETYNSEVSNYIAKYIRNITNNQCELPEVEKKSRIGGNVNILNDWLFRIANAHITGSPLDGKYPIGSLIMSSDFQSYVWKYEREELAIIVQQRNEKKSTPEYRTTALAQLFLFANYLLQRCCLTITKPLNEDWAFDMFQSLNATGTPLTAMETFRPLVIREEERHKIIYENSISSKNMQRVDELLNVKDNATKNTLTNTVLTSFALSYNGDKLPSKFSAQRKWLNDQYLALNNLNERRSFTEYLGDVADFNNRCWQMRYTKEPEIIPGIEHHAEKRLASFLMKYIKDANFQIIGSVLCRFYEGVIKSRKGADKEFIESIKASAAFFTLWRSARSNSGLDDVFRRLMRDGFVENGSSNSPLSWASHPAAPLASQIKKYYKYILKKENISTRSEWIIKAKGVNYRSAKIVCRFLLFVSAHETDVDPNNPGLMIPSTKGVNFMYDPELWKSFDFKDIEHIAPKNPSELSEWDSNLYPEEAFNEIGNLTLLPKEINSSAGNKNWQTKLLYYQHLGITIPSIIERLREEAKIQGIVLAQETIDLLCGAKHSHHMKPIIQRPMNMPWDLQIVQSRTNRILELTWDRMNEWLND